MKFKRLLTVGMMALFCAGTAMAASQLHSVQVTPAANAATVSLRTTGSFAHKEYRPDEHLVLVDLTGVTADPAVERSAALSSTILKGYKLSSYTSASGSEVTRIELAIGDGVSIEVKDNSDGLQIRLSSGTANRSDAVPFTSIASSFPSASPENRAAMPKPAVVDPSKTSVPVLGNAAPLTKGTGPHETAQAVTPTPANHPAEPLQARPAASPAAPNAAISALTPITIQSVSVQRGHGTLDIVIEGPNEAHPFLLKNPDRLVLDFRNTVVRPSVKNIAVHTKDVLQIRVGHSQAVPPVVRIVIDLSGPRTFDVVTSSNQVVVRVKTEEAELFVPQLKTAPALVVAAPTLALAPSSIPALDPASAPARALAPSPAPSAAGAPNPALSRTPALALTLAPSSIPALAPAPVPARALALSPAPSPAGAPNPALSRTPALALTLAPSPLPALDPASAPARALAPSPAPSAARAPNPALSRAPALALTLAPSSIPALAPAPAPARALAPSPAPSPARAPNPALSRSSALALTLAPSPLPALDPASAPARALAPSPAPSAARAPNPALSRAPALALTLAPSPLPALDPASAPARALAPSPAHGPALSTNPALATAPALALARAPSPVPALAPAPVPALATAEAPVVAGRTYLGSSSLQNVHVARAALASAARRPPVDEVVIPALNSTAQLREQRIRNPKARAGIAAARMASSQQDSQPMVQVARLNPLISEQLSGNAASGAPSISKYTGEPISVNFKDVDLKDFFRLIHEISGLNIVLDPNVKGVVTLVLDDVPWDQALDIVLKNNALDRELQGNVLRIAATDTLRREAVDRRAQSEAVALAVDRQTISRFISYAKAKDIVPTIKKFLTARGDVIADERTNALIISDIPSVLPNLDRLISQLDRKSQEVEIELRVVSATRSFSRDLGFQLGFNWGNGVSTIGGTNPNGGAGNATSGGGTSTSPGTSVPLFSNLPVIGATTGLSLSNITKTYGIDAVLSAAESHNLVKVLSRPRVVTQSNVKAEVKQGVKIPVATPSTGNSIATVAYVDAVLRLSVTPQITSDNTIFLTVDVENTQPSGTINGNQILTTQQATTQVLVTDGGTVVIGGVIQTTNSVSTTQTPLLGDIPWLGNLFKQRSVKTETDELIFFITPKIIQT